MKLNISIDDVSPHPKSSTKVLANCFSLLETHPGAKFTLFVPIAYWRTLNHSTKSALFINEYPEFCETLRKLPKENFQIGYHGWYHGIPGKSDNDEFWHLSKADAREKFLLMKTVVSLAKMSDTFSPVFRPPAWRMSPGAIDVAREEGFKVLALSQQDYAKKTYEMKDEECNDVVYMSCCPPTLPLQHHEKNELVYHACEWDKNHLSTDRVDELRAWLNNQDNIDYVFIEGLL